MISSTLFLMLFIRRTHSNLYNSVDGSVSISVLRWNSVIQDNKFKYEFLKRQLNYKLRDDPNYAMDYLMKKYGELFPNSQNELQ